jgi:adenylate kinase
LAQPLRARLPYTKTPMRLLLALLLAAPAGAADRSIKTVTLPTIATLGANAAPHAVPKFALPLLPSAPHTVNVIKHAQTMQAIVAANAEKAKAQAVPLPVRLAQTSEGVTAAMAAVEKGASPAAAGHDIQRLLTGEKTISGSAFAGAPVVAASPAPRDEAGAKKAAAAGPDLARRADDLGAAKGLRIKSMTGAQFIASVKEAAARADAEDSDASSQRVRAALVRVVEALVPADKPMLESAGRLFSVWQVFGEESLRVAAETGSPQAVALDAELFAAQVEASVPEAEKKKEVPPPQAERDVTPEDPDGHAANAVEGSVFGWKPIETSPGHGFAPLDALIRWALKEKKSPYAGGFELAGAKTHSDASVHFYGERHTDGNLIKANMGRLLADAKAGRQMVVLVEGYTGRDLLGQEALEYLAKRGLDAEAVKKKGVGGVIVSSWEGENYEISQRPLLRHHMELLELNRLAHSELRGWRYYAAVARAGWTAWLGRRELWKIAIGERNKDLDAAVAAAAAAAKSSGATVHVIAGTDHLMQKPRLGAALPWLFKPAFRESLKAALGGGPYWASQPANTPAAKPLRLLIMGPPASGKGTYALRLAADYGIVHVSAGDLLREYSKTHPEIAEIMERGELVPAALIVELVRERLKKDDIREKGFILDGFPRRLAEAQELKLMMKAEGLAFDAAIRLDVPEAELLRRVLLRGRPDDTEPTFRNRMKIYRAQSVPAMDFISRGETVVKPRLIDGGPEANYSELRRRLDRAVEPGPLARLWRALKRLLARI